MSQPLKIYFVRHGESEANVINRFSNRGWKHPLTEKGVAQAHALTETLENENILAIFSSPLMRAVQTAQILAEKLEVEYQVVDALREYDTGVLEDTGDNEAIAEFRRVRAEWVERGNFTARIRGGESLLEVQSRLAPFVENVRQTYRESGGVLVMVAHGGIYQVALHFVLRNLDLSVAHRLPIPNTGIIMTEETAVGLMCRKWCGTAME